MLRSKHRRRSRRRCKLRRWGCKLRRWGCTVRIRLLRLLHHRRGSRYWLGSILRRHA